MKQWEYLTRDNKMGLSKLALDKLGSQGWELVSHMSNRSARDFNHYIFKRQLPTLNEGE